MDFISGQLISLTNPIHRILGQFVNKPWKRLFCDRALLTITKFDSQYFTQSGFGGLAMGQACLFWLYVALDMYSCGHIAIVPACSQGPNDCFLQCCHTGIPGCGYETRTT